MLMFIHLQNGKKQYAIHLASSMRLLCSNLELFFSSMRTKISYFFYLFPLIFSSINMLYTRIKNTTFIASTRYNNILNLTYQPTFIFTKIPIPKPTKKQTVPKTNFMNFDHIQKITQLHKDYLLSIKSNASPDNFLPILYKAELTGATIEINNEKGVIIDERENVLKVYINDKVKTYVKNSINFVIKVDGVSYTFCGKNLKKNRFIRK